MTTPHPTPEERYEAAVNVATKNWLDHCQLCEHENQQNVESLLHMLQIESVAAIREAEAAGEARGRAMEREQMLPYAPAPTRSPPMTDSAETMREALKEARDTLEALRKQLHGEPFAQNRDRWLNLGMRTVDAIKKADAALSASGTKSDGGVESRHAKTGNMSGAVPEEEQSLPASGFVRAFGPEDKTSKPRDGVAPIPSDPIPSQPDEREAIAEAIWRAEYRRATGRERSIPWSEVSNNDHERYCYIARAILAMQAERRGVKP